MGWAALQLDSEASLLPHVCSFRTATSPECVQFRNISPPSVFPFSSSLSLPPWRLLFSSLSSLPVICPLTVMASEGVTATHLQAGQGRDAPPAEAWRWRSFQGHEKGWACPHFPSSLPGRVSTPRGPRVWRNSLPGGAASSAAQPRQRNHSRHPPSPSPHSLRCRPLADRPLLSIPL